MLNYSEETKNNIQTIYVEFLRELNLDFQILVVNREMNLNRYLDEYTNNLDLISSDLLINIYSRYIEEIRQKIIDEKIYETKYYIIVAIRDLNIQTVEDVDKIIYKFNKIGCDVKRIDSKRKYEEILYECINKEILI
jgi:hypothetical protein